jgi:autophagy-related protein 11
MLEVEDWTQPGTSKRRQNSKKASILTEQREDTPVPLSAPPENEVEETFRPTRAPNSRHFPAARSGMNSTTPAAGPSSLSRLLAQAPATSEPAPPDPTLPALDSDTSPIRTPSPPLPVLSSSPARSLPATATSSGRPHQPHSSSPLRPGSRASRLSTSSRLSAPRLPAFGGAGGSAAKAVPTTAITAPSVLDEPGSEAVGPTPTATTTTTTQAPQPAESVGEGMASLLARRRTTSFHVPASGSPLAAPVPRQTAGPAGALASLANWSTSFSRRRKMASESSTSTSTSTPTAQAPAPAPAPAPSRTASREGSPSGRSEAERFLQRF